MQFKNGTHKRRFMSVEKEKLYAFFMPKIKRRNYDRENEFREGKIGGTNAAINACS